MRALAVLALLAGGPAVAQDPAAPPPVAAPAPAPAAPKPPPPPARVTPNAERDVVIGALDKRTGQTRAFKGHPGQQFDFGSLHVVVRTCETTPPWEQKLTGAFLLIDDRLGAQAKRVFSGWMFAESPSLHPLEHPRYDIWVKSCTMRFPETGPNTVSATRAAAPPSSAKKSSETVSAAPN
jgi:hypothetical protein